MAKLKWQLQRFQRPARSGLEDLQGMHPAKSFEASQCAVSCCAACKG